MLQFRYYILEDALNVSNFKHIFHKNVDHLLSWLFDLCLSKMGISFWQNLSFAEPFSHLISTKVKSVSELIKHALMFSCLQGIKNEEYWNFRLVFVNNELSVEYIYKLMRFLLSLRIVLIFVAFIVQTESRVHFKEPVFSINNEHLWWVNSLKK